MARIRTIKPGFFRNEDLFDAEERTGLPLRVAFAGLWTIADREGRFRWRPRAIKPDVLPYDEVNFGAVLDALVDAGQIVKYEVDGEMYGHIPTFTTHQHVNSREADSEIPAPDMGDARTCTHVKVKAEQEQEQEGEETLPPPQASGGAPVEIEDPDDRPDPLAPPAALDRVKYPPDFGELWVDYREIAAPNATKADAFRSWKRLTAADKEACRRGLSSYVQWVKAERRKRPETPVKHLATFINKRAWEPFQELVLSPTNPTTWVTEDDPRWPDLAARYQREKGRALSPTGSRHRPGMGYEFPSDWLEQEAA